MISRDQAIAVRPDTTPESLWPWEHNNFHAPHPTRPGKCANWRRNGKTQTWKRNLDRFRIPVKFGLYAYDAIDESNLTDGSQLYVAEECPRCQVTDK